MLTLDSEQLERQAEAQRKERCAELRRRAIEGNEATNAASVSRDAGRPPTDAEAQLGKPMHVNEVIRRLKRCNSRLHFELANSDGKTWGCYLLVREATAAGTMQSNKKFICGVGSGLMPEFSVLAESVVNTPNKELMGVTTASRDIDWVKTRTFREETARGWRTVLVRLLHARIITEHDCRKHFTWTPSQESEKWATAVH